MLCRSFWEESVGYEFTFNADGSYRLFWTRTYDSWWASELWQAKAHAKAEVDTG